MNANGKLLYNKVFAQLKNSLADGRYEEVEQLLQTMRYSLSGDENATVIIDLLAAAAHAHAAATSEKQEHKIAVVVSETGKSTVSGLSQLSPQESFHVNGCSRGTVDPFEPLRRFSSRWQQYLDRVEAGNLPAGEVVLQELLDELGSAL